MKGQIFKGLLTGLNGISIGPLLQIIALHRTFEDFKWVLIVPSIWIPLINQLTVTVRIRFHLAAIPGPSGLVALVCATPPSPVSLSGACTGGLGRTFNEFGGFQFAAKY